MLACDTAFWKKMRLSGFASSCIERLNKCISSERCVMKGLVCHTSFGASFPSVRRLLKDIYSHAVFLISKLNWQALQKPSLPTMCQYLTNACKTHGMQQEPSMDDICGGFEYTINYPQSFSWKCFSFAICAPRCSEERMWERLTGIDLNDAVSSFVFLTRTHTRSVGDVHHTLAALFDCLFLSAD